jgi:N-acetylmuramic acid 6-phosphate etherase
MTIDRASIRDALDIMHQEDRRCIEVVEACRDDIAAAIERVSEAFRKGGRLIYVGAGTSGRLGVLDASEQPPTFGVSPDMVQGIIAGGPTALTRSIEGAEDHPEEGTAAVSGAAVGSNDVVFGITTGGRAPFVLGAIAEARKRGAASVLLTCTPPLEGEEDLADVQIHALTGPEVVTGSTRLKAGTVTKLVLNQVTTIAMIQYGKVYENLMVDLKPVNRKLVDRACRILNELAGLDMEKSERVLEVSGMDLKVALVMTIAGLTAEDAHDFLNSSGGHVARAIEQASEKS